MSERSQHEMSLSPQTGEVDGPASVIRVNNLGHRYGDQDPVLHGVNLEVRKGEVLSILGASGSGKSTFLRAIAGFVTPTQGQIELDGQLVCADGTEHVGAQERRLGMMFQDYALFPFMSVADNVAYGIHTRPDRQKRVGELLELVGLTGYDARAPGTLSGGQQQRVALVRALAPRPIALLLDEPFANLDGALRASVGDEVRRILREEKTTGLLVTHDRSEALGLADRVALFGPVGPDRQPGLIQIGSPDHVYHHPATVEAALLTGPATFVDGEGNGASVDTPFGHLELSTPMHGPLSIMVRPHQWCFTEGEGGRATVVEQQFTGPGFRVRITGPIGSLWVSVPGPVPQVGARGEITITGPVRPYRR